MGHLEVPSGPVCSGLFQDVQRRDEYLVQSPQRFDVEVFADGAKDECRTDGRAPRPYATAVIDVDPLRESTEYVIPAHVQVLTNTLGAGVPELPVATAQCLFGNHPKCFQGVSEQTLGFVALRPAEVT